MTAEQWQTISVSAGLSAVIAWVSILINSRLQDEKAARKPKRLRITVNLGDSGYMFQDVLDKTEPIIRDDRRVIPRLYWTIMKIGTPYHDALQVMEHDLLGRDGMMIGAIASAQQPEVKGGQRLTGSVPLTRIARILKDQGRSGTTSVRMWCRDGWGRQSFSKRIRIDIGSLLAAADAAKSDAQTPPMNPPDVESSADGQLVPSDGRQQNDG